MFCSDGTTLTVPPENLNAKIEVKFLTGTVENLSGKVWTPRPAKFLFGKGVVAWMLGYSTGKRKEGCKQRIANIGLRVLLLLALLGNITIRQFHENGAKILSSSVWTKCPVNFFKRFKIRPVPCEHNLTPYYVLGSERRIYQSRQGIGQNWC